MNLFGVMKWLCYCLSNSIPTHCYVSVRSDEGTILSTLLHWVLAVCWGGGQGVSHQWVLVPGTLGSLPGHPWGGSVQPSGHPSSPKRLFTGNAGRSHGSGGWRGHIGSGEEKKVTATGCRFPDSWVNNMMWLECQICITVSAVSQECPKSPHGPLVGSKISLKTVEHMAHKSPWTKEVVVERQHCLNSSHKSTGSLLRKKCNNTKGNFQFCTAFAQAHANRHCSLYMISSTVHQKCPNTFLTNSLFSRPPTCQNSGLNQGPSHLQPDSPN